jgi:hypothetical protein
LRDGLKSLKEQWTRDVKVLKGEMRAQAEKDRIEREKTVSRRNPEA